MIVRTDTSAHSWPLTGQRCFLGCTASHWDDEQQSFMVIIGPMTGSPTHQDINGTTLSTGASSGPMHDALHGADADAQPSSDLLDALALQARCSDTFLDDLVRPRPAEGFALCPRV
ncbi:MAG: hypothetical protein WBG92_05845 [Thiohalocapsa sp.]